MSRKGLGRGLASLIPDDTFEEESGEGARPRLRFVPLDEIQPNPEQPREVFDKDALDQLANSIRAHGVLSPLVVQRSEGRYLLLAGERRLRASAIAGLTEVPVIVRQVQGSDGSLEVALIENLLREDLDPVEEARGFRRLIEEFEWTQAEVAERVGRSRSAVANAVRLLRLPDFVLQTLREGRISAGHARALLPIEDRDELRSALARVLAHQLSVRATERLVVQLTRANPAVRTLERRARERTYAYATELLTEALRTSVQIRPRKDGSGRILIDYADGEDLERLISSLRATDPSVGSETA